MTAIAHSFASNGEVGRPGRDPEALARLRSVIEASGTAPEKRADPVGGAVPVHTVLRPLFPGGQLQRGTIVAVEDRVQPWSQAGTSYLTLAMLAGASAGGAWCGVLGLPDLGIAAAAGLGADLRRVLLVDGPGDRWADALAVLSDAVDLLVVRAPARPSAEVLRRVTARVRTTARQRGTVLVVAGPWPGAQLSLTARDPVWTGLGDGFGNLTGRRVTVSSVGRAVGHQQRSLRLWLPAADGSLAEAAEADHPQRSGDTGRPRLRIA